MIKISSGRYTWRLFLLFILFNLFFGLFFLRGFCRFLFGGLLAVLAFAHNVVSLSLRLCCVPIPETFIRIKYHVIPWINMSVEQNEGIEACLLHSHALRQVARLIHIGPLKHRHMVGKELHRHRQEDGGHVVAILRDFDGDLRLRLQPFITG